MNKKFILRTLVLASVGTLALTGCGSDKHKSQPPVSTSTANTAVIKTLTDKAPTAATAVKKTPAPSISATHLTATITDADIDADLILSFNIKVVDENKQNVTGLTTADIGSIALGRIGSTNDVPSMGGVPNTKIWLSYFNGKDKTNNNLTGGYSYFKGSSCADDSCLIDNGDGTYHVTVKDHPITTKPYTFKYDINKVTGIYLSLKTKNDQDATVISNSFYYWTPGTGKAVTNNPKKVIQDPTKTCNSCHQGNMRHSGKHLSSEACSFCHTAYSKGTDKVTGKVTSMYVANLVHSRHVGLGITNCASCHTADKTNTDSDVNLWHNTSNNVVCASCHSNKANTMYGAFSKTHMNAATDTLTRKSCTTCHTATSTWTAVMPHQPK